jgi:REP-associated tyrosine transposase
VPQSLSRILVHIVFSTKDRYPFLRDLTIREEMHCYLCGILNNRGSPALLVGGVSDHVHILCQLSRTTAISNLIGETKQASLLWVKEKHGMLAQFYWQSGYGAFSIGQSQLASIRRYIATQEEHHRKLSFQDEFRGFLRKYELEYDERYVWD